MNKNLPFPDCDVSEFESIMNMTSEERDTAMEDFKKHCMTKEETEKWELEMINSGCVMGYIDENGHPHVLSGFRPQTNI